MCSIPGARPCLSRENQTNLYPKGRITFTTVMASSNPGNEHLMDGAIAGSAPVTSPIEL